MTPLIHSSATLLLLLLLLARLPLHKGQAEWVETAKLTTTPINVDPREMFGSVVAIDNGILAVGAHRKHSNPALNSTGSVTMFERVGKRWKEKQKLIIANDASEWNFQGISLALCEETVAMGVYGNYKGVSGAVYIYGKEDGGLWTEQAKLLPTNVTELKYFGSSLAMEGHTLIVGASESFALKGAGSVYVFTFSEDTWTERAKLTAADVKSADGFGYAVAISEETLVVGAPGEGNRGGVAYVFQGKGGVWTQQAKLAPGEGKGNFLERYGHDVAVEGNTVCVSSKNYADGSAVGGVYIFGQKERSWTQNAKLVASDFASNARFGISSGGPLALRDGLLFVGAIIGDTNFTGALYVFSYTQDTWSEQAKIVASDGVAGEFFGHAVDFDEGVLIVGASRANDDEGSVYTFEWGSSSGPDRRLWRAALFILPVALLGLARVRARQTQKTDRFAE